jgi:hypothetical protein
MPDPIRILAVTYGGGHAKMIPPVIRALEARASVDARVLALTTARKPIEDAGLACFGFRELAGPGDEAAMETGRRLAAALTQHPDVDPAETEAYLGLSYHDLEARHGAGAARLFAERGRQAFLPLSIMERAFDLVRPDLVLATNSPRAEEACIRLARQRGVPAVCMVDLFGGLHVPRIRQADYADRVCVLSDRTKRMLVEGGRDPGDIVVTGNPAFDTLADQAHRRAALRLREQMGWNGRRVITWISQLEPGDPGLPRRVDRELASLVERHPDWRLVVRPHPSEQALPNEAFPERAHVSRQCEPLPALLLASDAVIVICSTVGVEAALLGRPVVLLDVPVTVERAPYVEIGAAVPALGLEGLEAAILEALAQGRNPCRSLPPVGGAAERVAEVCLELVA